MREYSGKSVCVTGGAGFIGSHLVDALVNAGARVRVLDDLSTGNIAHLAGHGSAVEVVKESVVSRPAALRAVHGVSAVFHLGAYVSAAGSVSEPEKCHEINTTGTLNLLRACTDSNVQRVVLASSAAVYGDSEVVPKTEDQPVMACSVYAQSKAAGEQLLRVWASCYGLEAVSLRFFNVFGPRQTAASAYAAVIAAFAEKLLRGKPATIYGDGGQTRDFVPVENVVQAIMRAGVWSGPARGEAFNVGLGRATSVRELASLMASLVGAKDEPIFQPARPGDVRHSLADISRTRRELGYDPQVSVREGLDRTLKWYRGVIGGA